MALGSALNHESEDTASPRATPPENAAASSSDIPTSQVAAPLAIISDIHSNFEALTAVLAEIDRRNITRIACLGDVIGYGPNPLECMDLVLQRCEFSLMGNHDFAIFYEPHNFNTAAENAAFWTRSQFENDPETERRNQRWRHLGVMQTRIARDRFIAVHASPRRPINEYIFPDDTYSAPGKIAAIFERVPHLCFVGHTHVPGVFVTDPDFYSPDELAGRYGLTSAKAIVNVGSVGQPRDRDPRASFGILHADSVEFVRVPYDVQTTVEKVQAIDALDNFLGLRLLEGR